MGVHDGTGESGIVVSEVLTGMTVEAAMKGNERANEPQENDGYSLIEKPSIRNCGNLSPLI